MCEQAFSLHMCNQAFRLHMCEQAFSPHMCEQAFSCTCVNMPQLHMCEQAFSPHLCEQAFSPHLCEQTFSPHMGEQAFSIAALPLGADEIIALLIRRGCDIHVEDSKGKTSLHCCAKVSEQKTKGEKKSRIQCATCSYTVPTV